MKSLCAAGLLAITTVSAMAQSTRQITLESTDDRRVSRKVDHNGRVRLVRKLSDRPCVEGRSWGYDRSSIWVDDGCRAVFSYEVGRDDRDRDDDRNRGGILDRIRFDDLFGTNRDRNNTRTERIKVESDGDRTYRRVDTTGGVRLVRKLSDKPCVQGRSWGYDRNGIWTDDGCRAEFEVRGRNTRDRNRDDRGQIWLPGRGVPNWAVGDWQGIRNADDLDMRIRSDGSVVIGRNNALLSGARGEIRGNRIEIDGYDFRIEKEGNNGIVLYPTDSRTGPLRFRKDR